MPKITEVRIKRVKRLRDYENLELGFTVNLDDEPAGPAIEKLTAFLDWQVNAHEWRKTRDRKQIELDAIKAKNGTSTPAEQANAVDLYRWIQNFDAKADEMAEIGKTL